eukprot:CAMPEP_0171836786 /NCGR_PEP_ID=MMETSP0992-20121227/11788_1 /TAXON_ID=483369 /ORGANISM="non described non described, Strain CCMP2098" /LENGTH=143 /DNA_ID=CAMNT_0012452871 /DNA_START=107 /DNA_END=535 /DNA_ORIENTATION=-
MPMQANIGNFEPTLYELAALFCFDLSDFCAGGDVRATWNVGSFGHAIGGVHVDTVLCKQGGHERAHGVAPVDDFDVLGRSCSSGDEACGDVVEELPDTALVVGSSPVHMSGRFCEARGCACRRTAAVWRCGVLPVAAVAVVDA